MAVVYAESELSHGAVSFSLTTGMAGSMRRIKCCARVGTFRDAQRRGAWLPGPVHQGLHSKQGHLRRPQEPGFA